MSRRRFDHSDRSDDTKEVPATAHPRRIEVITGVERRRKWSAQEKAAIVAESLAEGAVVSEPSVVGIDDDFEQCLTPWRPTGATIPNRARCARN